MNRHPSDCRCCAAPAAVETPEPEPIALPDAATPIRVHIEGLPPFDCTLHPDGTLTAVFGGELRRNFMSFDDMRDRGWVGARIEFDPLPLAELESLDEAAALPVQEALIA